MPRSAPAPALSVREILRWGWRQLTSMRTALVLLFAGALAAIPGSIVPQRPLNPIRVDDFVQEHPRLGRAYEAIGLFDVYASPWFSAIYLLLLVSLMGCIVPRILVYYRALRAQPSLTPTRLSRMPQHREFVTTAPEHRTLDAAASALRRRRFRVVRRDDSVSAERGYLREAGNLLFHLSLIVILFGVALGATGGYRGNVIVVVGQGFANNITQYDDLTAGARFTAADLQPFSLTVNSFDVEFERGSVQTGAARLFSANVSVLERPGATPRTVDLEVNKPLIIDGTTVHLVGHGYAPTVTVRDGNGDVAFSGPVPFLPQDGNFTSAGAIKAPDARPDRLGFQGFFLPTATVDERGPRSIFPDAVLPELFLNAWYGPPRVESGRPENVYSLDTAGLTQATQDGEPVRLRLSPGQGYDLPDGRGSITMDGWTRWVKLQVAHQPGLPITLGGVAAAVAGLCLSLFVRPRRLWVRTRGGRVEVAGLDRVDSRVGLEEEVRRLTDTLCQELGGSEAGGSEAGGSEVGGSELGGSGPPGAASRASDGEERDDVRQDDNVGRSQADD